MSQCPPSWAHLPPPTTASAVSLALVSAASSLRRKAQARGPTLEQGLSLRRDFSEPGASVPAIRGLRHVLLEGPPACPFRARGGISLKSRAGVGLSPHVPQSNRNWVFVLLGGVRKGA